MDFFTAQDSARSRSKLLVVLFVAAVVAIILVIYFVVHTVMGPGVGVGIDPILLAVVAAGVIALVSGGSAVRTMQLRRGGSAVAEMLGGRRVSPSSADEHERRLINVVEEMAIASGTPVPAIYVMDREDGINAFAAGYTLDDAAVAVTRGALLTLNRQELQGVVAHEFSHILNGDMRLNIRLMGLLFGILLLAVVGRGLLRGGYIGGGRRGRNGGGQLALVGVALVVVGYIGVFFGRLIQAAVSRQREYLADASAVQFTRDPHGIAGALKKIGGIPTGSRIMDHHAAEASHMFFANGISRSMSGLTASHPPLPERIRRIDPSFRGEFAAVDPARAAAEATASFAATAPAPRLSGHASAGNMMASVGTPRAEHVAYAHGLLESLPPAVYAAAHSVDDAPALLYALLGADDATARAAQRAALAEAGGIVLADRAASFADLLRPLGAGARLPLLDVLLPALRELSTERRAAVRRTAETLVQADDRVDMFELAVLHVLDRQLAEGRNAAAASNVRAKSLSALRNETALVLSAVAWSGAASEAGAADAFAAGAHAMRMDDPPPALIDRPRIEAASINTALEALRTASPGARRQFLEACTMAVAHDGRVQTAEAELLRAVAEALDCPMPPALTGDEATVGAG